MLAASPPAGLDLIRPAVCPAALRVAAVFPLASTGFRMGVALAAERAGSLLGSFDLATSQQALWDAALAVLPIWLLGVVIGALVSARSLARRPGGARKAHNKAASPPPSRPQLPRPKWTSQTRPGLLLASVALRRAALVLHLGLIVR